MFERIGVIGILAALVFIFFGICAATVGAPPVFMAATFVAAIATGSIGAISIFIHLCFVL